MRDLDTKDREILEILSKEARIALKALAATTGATTATGSNCCNASRPMATPSCWARWVLCLSTNT